MTTITTTATKAGLNTTTTAKPGWQTSEFWLKLAAILLTALYASGVIPTTGPLAQALAIGATILGALGYTVSRTMAKNAAAMQTLTGEVTSQEDAAAPAPARAPQAGHARLTLLTLLALFAVAACSLTVGCGASARQKEITTTMTVLDAAQAGYIAFDARHQLDIVKAAPDKATGEAQLGAWRQTQAKVETGLTAAWRAVAVAATVNNDQSMTSMLQAAQIVEQELAALGVKLP